MSGSVILTNINVHSFICMSPIMRAINLMMADSINRLYTQHTFDATPLHSIHTQTDRHTQHNNRLKIKQNNLLSQQLNSPSSTSSFNYNDTCSQHTIGRWTNTSDKCCFHHNPIHDGCWVR